MEDNTMNMIRFNQPSLSLIDQFFNSGMNENSKPYPANIYDSDNAFIIEMPVPGFSKEEIKLNLEQQVLKINAELNNQEEEVKDEKFLRREFIKTSLNRSFILPKSVDIEKINADYQNGVLKVTLPRREDAIIRKQIEIQ